MPDDRGFVEFDGDSQPNLIRAVASMAGGIAVGVWVVAMAILGGAAASD